MTDKLIENLRRVVVSGLGDKGWQVFLFGSRATASPQPSSDLDLMLRGSGPIPFSELGRFRTVLEESDLPYQIDLVDYHRCTPEFRERVLAAGAIELTSTAKT